MNNLVVLPIIIPLLSGIGLLFLHGSMRLQRQFSLFLTFLGLIASLLLGRQVWFFGTQTLQAGQWAAPFGISLVADLLAVVMLLLSGGIGTLAVLFAFRTVEVARQRMFFYPLFQFLIAGVNGAFLTGDLFNLFVFFEVLLIASYILVALGGRGFNLQEAFKYVMINSVGSALFLFGVAVVYGSTGTLNMAHLSLIVAEHGQSGPLAVAAVIFLLVFGLKGAIFPLFFWLPTAYFAPNTAVSAFFAGVLTKVGVYCILRIFTLVFNQDPGYTHTLILVLAGATMFIGVVGAVAQVDFKRILAYHSISQVGYMLMGIGIGNFWGIAGAILFMVHHSVVKSCLFFISGVSEQITGTTHLKQMGGLLSTHPGLTALFFTASMSLAGMPPLSGFFGKYLLLQAGLMDGHWLIVAVSLFVGTLTLFSMIKVLRYAFWGPQKGLRRSLGGHYGEMLAPALGLVAATVALGIWAGPALQYLALSAGELLNPQAYVEAVMAAGGKE